MSEMERINKWVNLYKDYRAIILSWEYTRRKLEYIRINGTDEEWGNMQFSEEMNDYLKLSNVFCYSNFTIDDIPEYILEMSDSCLNDSLGTHGVSMKNLLDR